MSTRTRIPNWTSVAMSCVILIGGLFLIIGPGPIKLLQRATVPPIELPASSARQAGDFPAPQPITVILDDQNGPVVPDSPLSIPLPGWSRCDNVVVDIKADGSLRVLGETMELSAFRTLLSDQLQDQLNTLVTIRPQADCEFRHVGPIIAVCQEIGVPHQMQSIATAIPSASPFPGGPA